MDRQLHNQLPAASSVTYRHPTSDDILYIVREMRRTDVRELMENPYCNDRTLHEIVRDSVSVSPHAWVACEDDVPFLMFGCAYTHQWIGCPWLFGTDNMVKHHKAILREAPYWLSLFSTGKFLLANLFDTRNTAHIRWARLLGFEPADKLNTNYQYMVKRV